MASVPMLSGGALLNALAFTGSSDIYSMFQNSDGRAIAQEGKR